MEKLSFIKIMNFYSVNGTVKRMKRNSTEWSKILAKHMSYKTLLS